jgi:zona occludens toxin (predicted ATPase)
MVGNETERAPEAEPSETELLPPATVRAQQLAYSASDETEAEDFDDDAEWDAEERAYGWGTVRIFAAFMAVTIVCAVWLIVMWTHRHHGGGDASAIAAQLPTTALPSATISAPAPAPPAAAAPPAVSDAPDADRKTAPEDRRYLAMLKADGFDPADIKDPIGGALSICRMVKGGKAPEQVVVDLSKPPVTFTQAQVVLLVADAMAAYCPHASS